MNNQEERQIFIQALRSKVGRLYRYGAEGPMYFDCSGLVRWGLFHCPTFQSRKDFQADIGAAGMAAYWKDCKIDKNAAQVGDLFFYGVSPDKISHVMVVNWKDVLDKGFGFGVIGSCSGGSSTLTDEEAWAQKAGVKAVIGEYWAEEFQFAVDPWQIFTLNKGA